MTFEDLDADVKQRVADELANGETVRWAGRANAKGLLLPSIGIMLFAIPWTGFAVFWTFMAFWMTNQAAPADNAPPGFNICFPLFGLPFIAVGVAMLCSPYWMKRFAARTVYVVTNRRAILFEAGLQGMTVRSFGPDQLQSLYRVERADGSGDLIFSETAYVGHKGAQRMHRLGFFGISNVREVEELLKQLAETDS